VITLLDHGLYQELTEDVRINYCYLWKGILTQNESIMKEAATKLGVGEFYPLLAAMVSRKEFKDLMDLSEGDFNKRLDVPNSAEEKSKIQAHAQQYAKEITMVLHLINRDVLLLFKTNDFLASITNSLGSPIKKYEITAHYCLKSIEEKETKEDVSVSKKIKLWYQRFNTMFWLKLADFYLTVASPFKASKTNQQQAVSA